jgi:hypothetical protein
VARCPGSWTGPTKRCLGWNRVSSPFQHSSKSQLTM